MPSPTVVPTPAGLVLAPFRALRYDTRVAGPLADLLAPPYDVIDDAGRDAYETQSPYNVVRLILPRGAESGDNSRYAASAALLAAWRTAGVLRADPDEAIYVYEMRAGAHVQRGLLGALALVDPDAGVVLPHENTMAGPVTDRLRLTEATEGNLEPIFLIYDGGGAASDVVASAGTAPPTAEATTDDGVEHRLWAVTDAATLAAIAADLRPRRAVIADGHHRFANFRRHQADRHAAGAGPGPWDFGLAFLVDATAFGPEVHAIHRVIAGLPAATAAEQAASTFDVRPIEGTVDDGLLALAAAGKAGPAFLLADDTGQWLLAEPDRAALAAHVPADRSAAWQALDVSVLHHLLVEGVWGIADTEDVVQYRHDVPAALAGARSTGGCAVLLNPTPVDALIAVAAAGERMPRKSTFFTPKPATGMTIRLYADA